MAAAITCAAISTSSSAIRMSTLGFLRSRAAAIRRRPRGFVFSSLGVVEVEDGLNESWRKCSRSSSLGVACDDRRRRRRREEEEGLWRRLRATGEGKSEVEDGDGLSSSVKDMERYLDELSIEYDSVWDTKPAWCQPWTIALTGVIGISASWLLLHSIVLTAVVSVLVSAWWFLFLYSYPLEIAVDLGFTNNFTTIILGSARKPQAYAQMIAQRRKDQKDGLEDTFGTRQRSN